MTQNQGCCDETCDLPVEWEVRLRYHDARIPPPGIKTCFTHVQAVVGDLALEAGSPTSSLPVKAIVATLVGESDSMYPKGAS